LALEHARKIQGELALNTLDKQVAKVRSVEAAKLELMKQTHESDLMDFKKKEVAKFKIAKTVLEDRIKLEKTRHIKEMDHLRDEIALLKINYTLFKKVRKRSRTYWRGASDLFYGRPCVAYGRWWQIAG